MSNLLRQPITLDFVKNAIEDYLSEKKKSITIDTHNRYCIKRIKH